MAMYGYVWQTAFFKRMAAMVFKNTSKMEVQGGAGMKHTAIILGKDKPTLVFLKTMAAIRLKNACSVRVYPLVCIAPSLASDTFRDFLQLY